MDINEQLDEHLLEKVLERLGFSKEPSVSNEDLTAIYQSWCQKIPFDNILRRVHMHAYKTKSLPGGSATEFFKTWLNTGAGGICWPGNGALCVLLRTLGFQSRLGVSVMVPSLQNNETSHIPKHGIAYVKLNEELMMVDTSLFHDKPILLKKTSYNPHPVWGTSVETLKNNWYIKWKPLGRPKTHCKIENFDVSSELFSHYHEIGRDLFNRSIIFRIARKNKIEGIVRGNKVIRSANGIETSTQIDSDITRKLLIEDFGILEELVSKIPDSEIINSDS